MSTLEADLALAHHLADVADGITLDRFRALDLTVELKSDQTPVTDADRDVELKLREILDQQRPADVVLGEEFGADTSVRGRRWIIDPIDGTKSFITGNEVWATLIALVDGDEVIIGVVSAPAMQRRWWAARGLGAFTSSESDQARPLHVSVTDQLQQACFAFSPRSDWSQRETQFVALQAQVSKVSANTDFFVHMLVAEGLIDIAAEPELSLWDIAALIPIVEEAGGQLSGFRNEDGLVAGCAVTTNSLLHAEVLSIFSS